MGGNVGKETKVTKEQALSGVSDAFGSTPRNGVVSVEEIVRAAVASGAREPNRLDRWKTTSVHMNDWSQKPHHLQCNTPRKSTLMTGGRIMTGPHANVTTQQESELKMLSTMPLHPSISWKAALDGGAMTRDARMKKIRTMFDALDLDGSHVVTENEFVQALADEGVVEKEARVLFREIDDSGTKRLTVAKFDHYVAVHTLSIVRESFKSLDSSKDRQIQRKEFTMYFMGNGLTKHQVSRLWNQMDCNNNGKISFTEFRDWGLDTLGSTSLDQVALSIGMSGGS